MTLTQRLAQAPGTRPAGRSIMDDWYETLTPTDREAVTTALTNQAWGHVALRDALAEEGAPKLSDTAFRVWRKKHGWTP